MDVPATLRGDFEQIRRQDLAVGDDDHQVGRQGGKCFGGVSIAQAFRLVYRDAGGDRRLLDGTGLQFAPAPGAPVRLGERGNRRKPVGQHGPERHRGEFGRPGEQDAQGAGLVHSRWLCVPATGGEPDAGRRSYAASRASWTPCAV
jgi:hypothetical protein